MRVLVVDDDVVVAMMLGLEVPEIELLEATRFDEGLGIAERQHPEAIVVDRRLPDGEGDGIELVRALRRRAGTQRTPIVVLSAAHDPAEEAAVLRAGADAYLAKPFDPRMVFAHFEAVAACPENDRRARRRRMIRDIESGVRLVSPPLSEPPAADEDAAESKPWRGRRLRGGGPASKRRETGSER